MFLLFFVFVEPVPSASCASFTFLQRLTGNLNRFSLTSAKNSKVQSLQSYVSKNFRKCQNYSMFWLVAGSDVAAIYKHFAENRPTLPLMYIVTPNSKMTSPFTRHVPTAQILTRVATLARAAFAALETQLLSCDSDSKDFKVGSHPHR